MPSFGGFENLEERGKGKNIEIRIKNLVFGYLWFLVWKIMIRVRVGKSLGWIERWMELKYNVECFCLNENYFVNFVKFLKIKKFLKS